MKFVIITHVEHIKADNFFYGYAPYVREMNIWIKYADKVTIVAPLDFRKNTAIHSKYEHKAIQFVPIPKMNLLNIKSFLNSFIHTPKTCWKIYKAMQKADHIHLRCPGNIGLLGCFIQILFPNKPKTAKNINLPNLAITANKPTLAKTLPATRPPIVQAATSSTEESNSSYLYPSLN